MGDALRHRSLERDGASARGVATQSDQFGENGRTFQVEGKELDRQPTIIETGQFSAEINIEPREGSRGCSIADK